MMRRVGYVLLLSGFVSLALRAQETPRVPAENDVYCSGMVTSEPVPQDTYVISGSDSQDRVIFSQDSLVFLNKGTAQGVKVGDEFFVERVVTEKLLFEWFVSQNTLLRAMGTTYEDEGRLRVVNAQRDTSTAQVVYSCGYIQRGDIVLPFAQRPAPALKPATKLDPFAPPSGKAKAMVVTTRAFGQVARSGTIVYVNLGSGQGVKVGDYFMVFRYQGGRSENVYQLPGMAYQLYGFGSTPKPYAGSELPRDIIGEGIVLRASPNAATVLITGSQREIFVGDYVEVE
jgi:hypothetical protein